MCRKSTTTKYRPRVPFIILNVGIVLCWVTSSACIGRELICAPASQRAAIVLGQEVVARGEEMHRGRVGGVVVVVLIDCGAFYFLALASESKAPDSESSVGCFNMEPERLAAAAAAATVQLWDELRSWLTSLGSRGTNICFPHQLITLYR